MKTILVTGAAGFIGFHLAQRLLQRGDQVIGLDNLNEYYDPTLKQARLATLQREANFEFHRLDLADDDGMRSLFTSHRFDAVAHLAAQAGVRYSLENPHAYVKSNIHGFLNVLEGTVTAVSARKGALVDVTLAVGGAVVISRISQQSCDRLALAPGRRAYALVKAVALDRHALGFA